MFLIGRRTRGRDGGFTLIELLVCIVILGIIAVPLSMALVSYFKNSDATQARLAESHDAQIAAAYFAQDVASVGTRSTVDNSLQQSVWLGSTGPYACGSGDAVLTLSWDDYSNLSKSVVVVVYEVQDDNELHRVDCSTNTDITVVRNLDVALTPNPDVTCDPSPCSIPKTIAMKIWVKAAGNRGDPYQFTLTGDRRQT